MLEPYSDWASPSKTFQITELILPTSCSARTLPRLNFSFLCLIPFFSYHLWLAKNNLHALCMFGNYPVNLSCLPICRLSLQRSCIVLCQVLDGVPTEKLQAIKALNNNGIILVLKATPLVSEAPCHVTAPWHPWVSPFMISSYPQCGPQSSLFVMHIMGF